MNSSNPSVSIGEGGLGEPRSSRYLRLRSPLRQEERHRWLPDEIVLDSLYLSVHVQDDSIPLS